MKSRPSNFLQLFLVASTVIACSPHTINLDPQPIVEGKSYSTLEPDPVISTVDGPWWSSFQDPVLDRIIRSALSANLTLGQGVARLLQAQALLEQSRGIRFPQLDLGASFNQSWDRDQDSEYQGTVGPNISWDPDLFGRLRSSQLARFYEYESEKFALEDLKLELSIQVAQTYFSALEQHLQLLLLKEQVEIDTDLLDLVERNFNAGVVSRVDYLQQKGQLADTKSLVPTTELTLRLFENRLSVLTGQAPHYSPDFLEFHETFPAVPIHPSSGIPSDLLINRPDLSAKKALLLAADAEIGRAIAERLPSIVLDGGYFYSTGTQGSGFISEAIGSLFQPLLNWGIRKAEVERNKALYQKRLYDFTQNYLIAIEEVENALYQINRQSEYLNRLQSRNEVLEQTLEETQRRYSAGVTDYLPVLDTLQQLREIERTVVTEKRNLMIFHAFLYRALGGELPEIEPSSN